MTTRPADAATDADGPAYLVSVGMVVDYCKDERPAMTFDIEIDRELDGRWIAEVPDLAGVMTYGATREEAVAHVQALALRVIADRLEHNEAPADLLTVTFRAAWAPGLPGKHGLFSPLSKGSAGD